MSTTTRTYPIPESIAKPLCDSTLIEIQNDSVEGSTTSTLSQAILQVTQQYKAINDYLANNPTLTHAADSISRTIKHRGNNPTLHISLDGTLSISLSKTKNKVKNARKTQSVPKLTTLRAEAAKLNLDISTLGRKRKDIAQLIESTKAANQPNA